MTTLHQKRARGPMPSEQILYRGIVAVAFVGAATSLIFSYLAGRNVKESLWTEARQAAHAVAGYAFKY